ncbi:amidohydrolase [Bacillus kwashiorkori]|uniref:amidohydrolase n=1 Tax=Bacillus kwashiorkori TaxID=1522318 RepID=UPI000785F8D5|nr:amidohydrolase [Bacillus kwashiorkori]
MGTLWFNGHIYTMEAEGEKVESIFTKDGTIIAVGKKQEILKKYHDEIGRRIDLQGKTLIPGLVDSHLHLIGFGETFLKLDLTKYKSKEEVLQAVQMFAEKSYDNEWIIGEGWNENQWIHNERITKEDIDHIIPHRPVILKRICRHTAVVNSKALQLANITKDTVQPTGGYIDKQTDGEPTGILSDNALNLVSQVMPKVNKTYLKQALRKAVEQCHQLGITGVHTEDLNYYGSYHETLAAFYEVLEEEGYLLRTHLLLHNGIIDEWYNEGNAYLGGTNLIEYGAMKIFADGSLGGRTALLSFPYVDDPSTTGVAIHTKEELTNLVKKAREMNVPIAVHAIGDLALQWVIDAIETYPAHKNTPDRIIHAPLVQKGDFERLCKLPVVLDIQPGFLASDFPWVFDRVGVGKIDYLYAWKSFLQAGIACAGGSDAPIEPINPLLGIYTAVTRTRENDKDKNVYSPEEKLTLFEAVCLYTKGSAYACGHEHDRGMISPGFIADFTIFDEDIFQNSAEKLLSTKVAMTVINDQIVYQNENILSFASFEN